MSASSIRRSSLPEVFDIMSTLTAPDAKSSPDAILMSDSTPSPPDDIQTATPEIFASSPARPHETGTKRLSDLDSTTTQLAPSKSLDGPANRLSRSTSHVVFPRPNNFSRKVRLSTAPSSEDFSRKARLSNNPSSEEAMSVNSMSDRNEVPRSSRGGHGRKVEFFSPATFQQVLLDPTTNHQLLLFARSRLCGEDVEFLGRTEQYNRMLADLTKMLVDIDQEFLSPKSKSQINMPEALLETTHNRVKLVVKKTTPVMELVLREAQQTMEQIVFADVYPRFVRHQMSSSASRALANDRYRYQGLGDCFCLTDPRIADNPIVYASDGFIKVTGYSRKQVIPRNCRFLQGQDTDRAAVARLRDSIKSGKESVELLLNYKENGEPFWNLLYCAPLVGSSGEVEFFIGGQINCSTTIHSNADIMNVLSSSEKASEPVPALPQYTPSIKASSSRNFFKTAFRSAHRQERVHIAAEAGAEIGMIRDLEGKSLPSQMQQFYSAYSKYLVVRYDNMNIDYCSNGIFEVLNPAIIGNSTAVGMNVFKFFKQSMMSRNQTDYQRKVQAALKAGSAISILLQLQTRRSAVFRGDEGFAVHWTPVKDEYAAVRYVVVCLSPTLE